MVKESFDMTFTELLKKHNYVPIPLGTIGFDKYGKAYFIQTNPEIDLLLNHPDVHSQDK